MQNLPLTVGDCVRVRRLRWRIVGVRWYDNCCLLALNGIDTGNRGLEKRLLLPFDVVDPIRSTEPVRFVGSRRWQRACRHLIAAHGGADALGAALTARIDLLPHQLEPSLAIVRGLTSRVLIADDVGLGKTIQAGLVAAELLRRGAAERILILTPAGLREQWIGELGDRFGLEVSLVDTAAIQQRRAWLSPDINPWSTFPLVLASLDYAKRPEVLPAIEACRWDLVIVDEAHGAVTASDRHAAVSRLAARAPYVLLLTATPHNGDAAAFASLCAIGDRADPLWVFRRTRQDIGLTASRRIRRLVVKPSAAERRMHDRLEEFTRAVRAEDANRSQDLSLALSTIQKRALSSAFALHQTVERRLAVLAGESPPAEQQLTLPLEEEPGEHGEEDAIPRWTCPALRDPAMERRLLSAIADAAGAAFADQAKLRVLRRLIGRIDEPVVIFTEYRDTLLHVRERVCPDASIIHGGLSRAERRAALDAFVGGDRRVLIATDAAGEGLNLQRTCRLVINLELPWNPMRLEQRIGRVDRIGQRRPVHAVHLVAAGTRELTMIERLRQRLARARQDIGVPDPLGSFGERAGTDMPSMRIDATEEYQRLADARRLTCTLGVRCDLPGSTPGTLIAITRSRLRARIGPRPLAVVRIALADDSGHAVAQEVRGWLLRTAATLRPVSKKLQARALLGSLTAAPSLPAARSLESWADVAMAIHTAFWTRRLERERSIRQAQAAPLHRLHQPGLFWRDRVDSPQSMASSPALPSGDGYVEAAERCLVVTRLPPAVVLLLLP